MAKNCSGVSTLKEMLDTYSIQEKVRQKVANASTISDCPTEDDDFERRWYDASDPRWRLSSSPASSESQCAAAPPPPPHVTLNGNHFDQLHPQGSDGFQSNSSRADYSSMLRSEWEPSEMYAWSDAAAMQSHIGAEMSQDYWPFTHNPTVTHSQTKHPDHHLRQRGAQNVPNSRRGKNNARVAPVTPAASMPITSRRYNQAAPGGARYRESLAMMGDNRQHLKTHLLALEDVEASRVVMVRKINHIGFNASQGLRAHFEQFGEVEEVLLPHCHVSSHSNYSNHIRLRPASLGFIVMRNSEGAARALAHPSHRVNGVDVGVYEFVHRETGGRGMGSRFADQYLDRRGHPAGEHRDNYFPTMGNEADLVDSFGLHQFEVLFL